MPTVKSKQASVTQGRGRPRSEEANQKILEAAYELLSEVGFNDLTIEGVAARAGVGKPTKYRRWSTKARLVMDAFVSAVTPELKFPDTGSVEEDIRRQMKQLVKMFNSHRGEIIATIIGGGQTDPELIAAFRDNWLVPRRAEAAKVLQQGVERGELSQDLDIEMALDAFYSPLFYRLLIKHQPLTLKFVDELVQTVMQGLVLEERQYCCDTHHNEQT